MGNTLLLSCGRSGAALRLEAVQRPATCPYCAYCAPPSVVERPPSRDRPDPPFAIGFRVDAAEAQKRVRAGAGASSIVAQRGSGNAWPSGRRRSRASS